MSPDLHSRIASELSRRQEVAKAAAQWSVQTVHVYMDGSAQVRLAAPGRPAVFPISVLHGADAQFLRDTEPAAEVRRYESALRVLERHAAKPLWNGGEIMGYFCVWCDPQRQPCPDLLDLAASLGLDTEGSTTDG